MTDHHSESDYHASICGSSKVNQIMMVSARKDDINSAHSIASTYKQHPWSWETR